MKILIIGANGKIGKKLVSKLAQHQHEVLAMVRKEEQKAQFEKKHVTPVLGDLEKDLSPVFEHKPDVVIFTAGSGAGTSQEKTVAIDLQGARKSIDEAKKHRTKHFIMVSALGANRASEMGEDMRQYFIAKSEADQHLVQSGLDYTILRPGRLTDEHGSGNIMAAEALEVSEPRDISRDNVANVITQIIADRSMNKKVIELLDGEVPIPKALAALEG